MSLTKSDLNKQAPALEVTFSWTTKLNQSQTIYSEFIWMRNWILSSYLSEKCSNAYKIKKSGLKQIHKWLKIMVECKSL